jgi:hypothetical protein
MGGPFFNLKMAADDDPGGNLRSVLILHWQYIGL